METKLSAEHPFVTNSVEFIQGLKDKLFPDPFAAEKAVIKENREGQIGGEITDKENWVGPVIKDAATDVLTQVAVGSAMKSTVGSTVPKLPPRSNTDMINVTPGGPIVKTPNPKDITVLTNLKNKITAPYKPWQTQAVPFGLTSPNITSEVYDAALSTGATARLRRRKGESDANFSIRLGAQLFDEINLTYDAELDVYNMLDRGGLSEKKRRIAKMLISNPDYSPKSFEDTRTLLVAEFLDGLEFLGLADRTIEAHHIASLRQVTSLFIGLPRSKFREMLKLVYAEGIPTGNDPKNLMAIQKKAHVNKKDNPNVYAVHTYLNEQLGVYGEKLVGDYGAKIKDLSVEERIPYIKTFAKVVKNSVPIAEQAIRDVLDLDIQEKDPGAFASAALDIEQYDISVSQMKQIKAKIKNKLELQFNNPGEEALLDAIRGENTPGEALRRRDAFSSQTTFDPSKKSPKKTKSKKISKNQQKYFDDPDVTKPTQ